MRYIFLVGLITLLLDACGGGGGDSDSSLTPTDEPASTEVTISAQNNAFSRSRIRVPAGEQILIEFTNREAAPHNIAFYESAAAEEEIYVGSTVRGPDNTVTYEFDAPEETGTYFYRCDVHPIVMTGDLIVE